MTFKVIKQKQASTQKLLPSSQNILYLLAFVFIYGDKIK